MLCSAPEYSPIGAAGFDKSDNCRRSSQESGKEEEAINKRRSRDSDVNVDGANWGSWCVEGIACEDRYGGIETVVG